MPVVVSFAFDLRKVEAASPPNASESVDVPWNFRSDIAVDKVIPFLIVVKPDMDVFGVNVSSDIIAIFLNSSFENFSEVSAKDFLLINSFNSLLLSKL